MTYLHVAHVEEQTVSEGPGKRFAVWVQGCKQLCPGCCNPDMRPLDGGTAEDVTELAERVIRAARIHGIEGVTLVGGEPFEQPRACGELAEIVMRAGLSVVVFTGYLLEDLALVGFGAPEVGLLLACTDLLIDGPFQEHNPDKERRWVGSSNQGVRFLTHRYDKSVLTGKNTAELHYRSGEVSYNGWPTRKK